MKQTVITDGIGTINCSIINLGIYNGNLGLYVGVKATGEIQFLFKYQGYNYYQTTFITPPRSEQFTHEKLGNIFNVIKMGNIEITNETERFKDGYERWWCAISVADHLFEEKEAHEAIDLWRKTLESIKEDFFQNKLKGE